jgi:hypothetical protein
MVAGRLRLDMAAHSIREVPNNRRQMENPMSYLHLDIRTLEGLEKKKKKQVRTRQSCLQEPGKSQQMMHKERARSDAYDAVRGR